jgi:hypothetical protein
VLILPLLDRTVALAWLDEAALLHHVAEAVGHPRTEGASRPARPVSW